jgi:mRNA interferase HicA
VKRRQLLKHLGEHGCVLDTEGRRHSKYLNPANGKKTAVPRHTEIDNVTARIICDQLGVPRVGR